MKPVVAPSTQALLLHGLRLASSGGALLGAVLMGAPALATLAATALFMAAFSANHDAVHGCLALPRRGREIAMAAFGFAMLLSSQAVRVMHLRHHARPLSEGDVEGMAASMPLSRALLALPRMATQYRAQAFLHAGPRIRRLILAETASHVVVVLLLLGSQSSAAYAALGSILLLQLTMPLWAGRVPHRPPGWLHRLARRLSWTRSALVLSLAYHEEHHRAPHVPCHLLHDPEGALP